MIKIFKKFTKTEDRKHLLSNLFSLSVLQMANYILPLITLPYLIRVLGIEYFGLLAFATVVITYFGIITDYGFNLTATREIAINRDNREKVIEIFSSVMIIKILLLIFSFLILSILIVYIDKFSNNWLVFYLTFGVVIGQVFFPIWFFQGMERMKYITYLNILAKTIFTVAVFIFVQEQKDFYIVPLLTSIGFIVVAVWSLIIIKKEFNITFKWQKKIILLTYFKDAWHIFIAQFSISLYRNMNVIILGFLSNDTIVGFYVVAEKLIKSVQSLQIPFGQALFPFISKKYSLLTKNESFYILDKYALKILFLYILLAFLTYIFSDFIVKLFVGNLNLNILQNLNIMTIVIIIGGMNYYYGVLGLVALKYNREFSQSVIITGIFNILFVSVCTYFYQDIGASVSLVVSESLLLLLIVKNIYKIKLRNLQYE